MTPVPARRTPERQLSWINWPRGIGDRRLRNGPASYDRINHGDYTQNGADTPHFIGDVFVASYPDVTESKEFAMGRFRVRVLWYITMSGPLFQESEWELHKTKRSALVLKSGMRDCTTPPRLITSNSNSQQSSHIIFFVTCGLQGMAK